MSVELAPGLDKLSLSQVIRSAVSHHERRTGATLAVKLHTLPEDGQLDLKNSVYRFVEDGLRLVSLNAKGALHEMEAACEGGLLCLEVMVAGQGTNVEGLLDLQHSDVHWLRRRVETSGGQFKIESLRGAETRMSARFRVNERNAFYE